jgi:sialate O-acetylesterase
MVKIRTYVSAKHPKASDFVVSSLPMSFVSLKLLQQLSLAVLALTMLSGQAYAADEAEFQVWTFDRQSSAWNGNGPLKFGAWPVKESSLRISITPKTAAPILEKKDLLLPSDKVNVIQIRADLGSATKGRLWFTTGISPKRNSQKMVEFDLQPGTGLQDYNLDLKSLRSWQDDIVSLSFSFSGAKAGDELKVSWIKAFLGDKISKPMVYSAYRLGQKYEPKPFRLGPLFSDGMVLQRGKAMPVWGRSKAGETVAVEFAGQRKVVTADMTGRWEARLDPMEACAVGRVLVATGEQSGLRAEAKDVLVGDVWLCGGQSNMGSRPTDSPPPEARRQELIETDYPAFRFVSMPTIHRDNPAPNDFTEDSFDWHRAHAKKAAVSAVGYYFGQSIHVSQKVPVGLIFIVKAGSQVEQWLDGETLRLLYSSEELKQICGTNRLAGGLYNGMVSPLPPFPIRGAFWYQGESNADNDFKVASYYQSLPAMINLWRRHWGSDLPVLLVQLPRFEGYPKNSWAHIREAQFLAATRLPGIGLAVTLDEGDPKDLHPANKYMVGTRLGLLAREIAYGEKNLARSPLFKSAETKSNEVEVTFDHVGAGLRARGDLTGFEIRGKDGVWVSATARINGPARVAISSPQIPGPEAARYCWGNSVDASLFNADGLPASPFRTDTPVRLIQQASAVTSPNAK